MIYKNNKGLTLVEVLLTITISFIILGLISNVLVQSTRANDISNIRINFRQEANIIIAILTSAHQSDGTGTYDIRFQHPDENNWAITIGNQQIQMGSYDLKLELQSGTQSIIIDTANGEFFSNTRTFPIDKKKTLYLKNMIFTNKKDKNKTFEMSTTISRL